LRNLHRANESRDPTEVSHTVPPVPHQTFSFALLSDFEDVQFILWQMSVDHLRDQIAQTIRRNRIEFAGEGVRPRLAVARPARKAAFSNAKIAPSRSERSFNVGRDLGRVVPGCDALWCWIGRAGHLAWALDRLTWLQHSPGTRPQEV